MDRIKDILREYVEERENKTLILKEDVGISKELKYHIDNGISLTDNVFRVYSEGYFKLVNEVRDLYNLGLIELNEEDSLMVESSLGEIAIINGKEIYLDAPFILEEDEEQINEVKHHGKNVNLGKPFRTPGGPKKFAVYVRKPGGGIKKVTFGFAKRHDCANKKDRTKASYWSCRLPRYAKLLGLKSNFSGFW